MFAAVDLPAFGPVVALYFMSYTIIASSLFVDLFTGILLDSFDKLSTIKEEDGEDGVSVAKMDHLDVITLKSSVAEGSSEQDAPINILVKNKKRELILGHQFCGGLQEVGSARMLQAVDDRSRCRFTSGLTYGGEEEIKNDIPLKNKNDILLDTKHDLLNEEARLKMQLDTVQQKLKDLNTVDSPQEELKEEQERKADEASE
jgi:hypothetical protein